MHLNNSNKSFWKQCNRFSSQTKHREKEWEMCTDKIGEVLMITFRGAEQSPSSPSVLFILDLRVSFLYETIAPIIAHNKCFRCHYSAFNLPFPCSLLSNCSLHIPIEGETNGNFMLPYFVDNCCSLLLISLTNKIAGIWSCSWYIY